MSHRGSSVGGRAAGSGGAAGGLRIPLRVPTSQAGGSEGVTPAAGPAPRGAPPPRHRRATHRHHLPRASVLSAQPLPQTRDCGRRVFVTCQARGHRRGPSGTGPGAPLAAPALHLDSRPPLLGDSAGPSGAARQSPPRCRRVPGAPGVGLRPSPPACSLPGTRRRRVDFRGLPRAQTLPALRGHSPSCPRPLGATGRPPGLGHRRPRPTLTPGRTRAHTPRRRRPPLAAHSRARRP